MDFKNKKALVCGLALSGVSAAKLLKNMGAEVIISDLKDFDKFDAKTRELETEGISLYLGKNPDDIITRQDLVVVSPGIPCGLPFLEAAKQAGVPVIAEIELAYMFTKCPIIAITGTNGKTTTTTIVGQVMNAFNGHTEVVGNIGIPFTGRVPKEDGCVVAEVSSFQLETVMNFKPKISAVLNITPDHINRHKSLENYIMMKERIFCNQTDTDFTVLNYDNKYCRGMAARTKAKTVFFSRNEELDEGVFLRGDIVVARLFGNDCEIVDSSKLNIFVENTIAAVALSLCAGVPVDIIRDTLLNFKAVEHRIEYVTEINGVDYYNDSKGTNPDAAIKAIESMKRPIILIGGGYDKDSDFSEWVKMFAGRVKRLFVLGEVADKIIAECNAYNFLEYTKVNSLRVAVELAHGMAVDGDCVLLSPACASWDMFDNYEQRGIMFKQFVLELKAYGKF